MPLEFTIKLSEGRTVMTSFKEQVDVHHDLNKFVHVLVELRIVSPFQYYTYGQARDLARRLGMGW